MPGARRQLLRHVGPLLGERRGEAVERPLHDVGNRGPLDQHELDGVEEQLGRDPEIALAHDRQVAQRDRHRKLLTLRVQQPHEFGEELACLRDGRSAAGLGARAHDLAELHEEVVEERLGVGGGREQVKDHPGRELALADLTQEGESAVAR